MTSVCEYISSGLLVLGAATGSVGASRTVRDTVARNARSARQTFSAALRWLRRKRKAVRPWIRKKWSTLRRLLQAVVVRFGGRSRPLQGSGATAAAGSATLSVGERDPTLEERLKELEAWREDNESDATIEARFLGRGSL